MNKCHSCGFNNPQGRERCLRCASALDSRALPDASHVADRTTIDFHPLIRIREFCFRLGRLTQGSVPSGLPHRWTWVAAYLSLLFGAGQLYNHQPRKAIIFAIIEAILVGIFLYTLFIPENDYVAAVLLAWFFFVTADGFTVAAKINETPWGIRHLAALWFAFMFYLGASVFIINTVGHGFFFTTTVMSARMAPALNEGDKLLVMGSLLHPDFKRGSIVYYDPEKYTIASTNTTFIINEQTSFGVVTALEGERMSLGEDGVLRVNGDPVDTARLPINPNGVAPHSLTIPPDHVGILISHGPSEGGIMGMLRGGAGSDLPPPRRAMEIGMGLLGYNEAIVVKKDQIIGIAVTCFYPPTSRRWWGWDGPLWKAPPADYPTPVRL